MKIEEIKGYLGMGVKCQWLRTEDNKTVTVDFTLSDYNFLKYKRAKLLLRPLSDLTKEIQIAEHYEEFFSHLVRECYNGDINFNLVEIDGIDVKFFKDGDFYKYAIGPRLGGGARFLEIDFSDIDNLNYNVVKWLYNWHFDIHDLITKGQAIDLNTIGKQLITK